MLKGHRILAAASLAGLNACATLVNGTSQMIPVTSAPAGLPVKVDGVPMGATPVGVTLERSKDHTIVIGQDSVSAKTIKVTRRASGWMAANLLWFYGLPVVIDLASGGGFVFKTDRVHASLGESAIAKSVSWIAPGTKVRIANPVNFDGAWVEWARGDSIAWRWTSHVYVADDSTAVVKARVSDVSVQVPIGRDRPNGGRTGMQVLGAITVGAPTVAGLASGNALGAAVGVALGAYMAPFTLPIGYAIGAASGHERWAPLSAYRQGLDLAQGDLVKVGANTWTPTEGRVRDMKGDTLIVDVDGRPRRFSRLESGTLQRARGTNFASGFRRGALVGAGLAIVGQSMCKCKQDQRALITVPLIGAAVGAWFSPLLAPRRWVRVDGW